MKAQQKVKLLVSGNAMELIDTKDHWTVIAYKINETVQDRIVDFLNSHKMELVNKSNFTWADRLEY